MKVIEVIEKVGLEADWTRGEGWTDLARHPEGFELLWNPHGQHLTVCGPVARFEGLRPDLFPALPTYSHGWLDLEKALELQRRRIERGEELPSHLTLSEVWKRSDVGTALVVAVLEVPTDGWEPACPSGHEWHWREWGLASFGTFRATILCKNCRCKKKNAPLATSPEEAELLRITEAFIKKKASFKDLKEAFRKAFCK